MKYVGARGRDTPAFGAGLNGERLREHRGAFGAFCFEITDALPENGTNLLAVRVGNAPAQDIAPLTGDFDVCAGRYRPVHLIVANPVNFALTDRDVVEMSSARVRNQRSLARFGQPCEEVVLIGNCMRTQKKRCCLMASRT